MTLKQTTMSEEQAKYSSRSEDNFKKSLRIEEEELRERILKLNAFILSENFVRAESKQKILLKLQLSAMKTYHECLTFRIIDLEG